MKVNIKEYLDYLSARENQNTGKQIVQRDVDGVIPQHILCRKCKLGLFLLQFTACVFKLHITVLPSILSNVCISGYVYNAS